MSFVDKTYRFTDGGGTFTVVAQDYEQGTEYVWIEDGQTGDRGRMELAELLAGHRRKDWQQVS